MAIRLTIVGGSCALAAIDIPITSSNRVGVSGTTVATDLQTAIRAAYDVAPALTVTFSTTTWKFTIDAIDSTSITIAAPSAIIYADASDLLFAKTGEEEDTSWTGNVPTDCNVEVNLPSDFLTLVGIEWDRNPLRQATYDLFESPQAVGNPQYYHIKNKTLRVNPVPTEQKLFFINYRYLPTTRGSTMYGYQEFGLNSKTAATETGLSGATTYYFYLAMNGGALTEYSITTVATTTFTAILALLNAAVTGAVFSLHGGDLRCTSSTAGATSSIIIEPGESGTDLLATLTGFDEMDPPDYFGSDEIDIPDEAEDAILFYATSVMCETDPNKANWWLARYNDAKNGYRMQVNNQNPKYRQHEKQTYNEYTVIT